MPAGPGTMGFVYFLGAKFVGYSVFCRWVVTPRVLARTGAEVRDSAVPVSIRAEPGEDIARLNSSPAAILPSAVKAGVVRTLIGAAVGAVVGLSFWNIPPLRNFDFATPLFFAILVPVRVGEWALLYRWIYRMRPFADPGGMKLITLGIFASFALDAIGMVSAMILPGGMWVC
jgi:hypothetical protein